MTLCKKYKNFIFYLEIVENLFMNLKSYKNHKTFYSKMVYQQIRMSLNEEGKTPSKYTKRNQLITKDKTNGEYYVDGRIKLNH